MTRPGFTVGASGVVDIQQPVQKTNIEIPWTVAAINVTDIDLQIWATATLGLYNPHPEIPGVQTVSVPTPSDAQPNINVLKFKDFKPIEKILASEENMYGENSLTGLIWQINKNMDVAIIGQHLLDMIYKDFVDVTKNEGVTQRALYAKLTLRF